MSKKLFPNEKVELLSKNKYIKNISQKGITYTDEFKQFFILENESLKKLDMIKRIVLKQNRIISC